MKKILALTSVLALAACGVSEDIAKHDADFAGCERIATSAMHLVYKCPADLKWIANLKKLEPNGVFKTFDGQEDLIRKVAEDKNVALVEVVLGDANTCKENFHYRTMIRPLSKENYAYLGCR